MTRREYVLAILYGTHGNLLTPVQVQKLFFLMDREAGHLTNGPHFDFKPFDYGPFDAEVYDELRELANDGLVDKVNNGRWTSYRLTEQGISQAEDYFQQLSPSARDYITKVTQFVRSLTFSQLVKAIYRQYPEMKANSIFQG